jgi:hypothetical protein
MADRQLHPFDKSGIQPTREAQSLQGDSESVFVSKMHHMPDFYELAPPVAFLHLAIDQTSRHLPLPHSPPARTSCEPVAKMGRQRIKVQV